MFYLMLEGRLKDGIMVEPDQYLKTEDIDKAYLLFLKAVSEGKEAYISTLPIILEEEDFTSID